MVSVQIDYYNLKFMIYEDDKLTMDSPLPAEIQKALLLQVIHDVIEEIRAQLNADAPDRPPGLKEQMIH